MSDSFDHLAPECRNEARLDTNDRVRAILTERWISYPRANFALQRLEDLLQYPPRDRMPCLLLFGPTGMGKTKILKKFIRDHAPTFNTKTGISGRPVVAIQMPPEPDEKALYLQLLNAVNAPTRYGHTVHHLRQIIRDLLSYTGTRMLVIDEVHSLLASSYRQQRILLNTLRFLANELQLVLVCADTDKSGRSRTRFRWEAERHSGPKVNAIPTRR